MNYDLVQREAETLSKDLSGLAQRIIQPPVEPQRQGLTMGHRIMPAPEVLSELGYIHGKLTHLIEYLEKSTHKEGPQI